MITETSVRSIGTYSRVSIDPHIGIHARSSPYPELKYVSYFELTRAANEMIERLFAA